MWIKLLFVFFIGLIESLLYTAYLISLDKRRLILSTFLMFSYMLIYLAIITFAIKDVSSYILIIAYALSSAIGNYIIVHGENNNFSIFKHRKTHPHHSRKK